VFGLDVVPSDPSLSDAYHQLRTSGAHFTPVSTSFSKIPEHTTEPITKRTPNHPINIVNMQHIQVVGD
jgi:hypothetical protein